MGWCSATIIFDNVCDALIGEGNAKLEPREALKALALALLDGDWDCESDSAYWDHPIVKSVMLEIGSRKEGEGG